jgi:hypothetical protein
MKVRLDIHQVQASDLFYEMELGNLQVAIYMACGGGWLGNIYAHSPGIATIDSSYGRLPYKRKEIEKMRLVLVAKAKHLNLDPNSLPKMPKLHNCGVF